MAVVDKKNIIERISKYDDDEHISLLEDISDSWGDVSENVEDLKSQIEELTNKVVDLRQKYISRFLTSDEKIDKEVKDFKDDDIIEEKKYIDVKEI